MQEHVLSIVIPTLNSARTLADALSAISRQRGGPRIEVVVADAGSTDDTLRVVRGVEAVSVTPNPFKTGEAGKAAGIKASTGEFIALVDSDNILDGPDWVERMLAPFEDPEIVASEPLYYTRREQDPPLTRYFAMLGMNDPLCLFLGNYDRYCMITGKWTGLPVQQEDKGDYLKLTLSEDTLPTIGANGFVFRRSLLKDVSWDPYFFDIDVMHQAVAAGHRHVAKVKCGIVHLYCSRLRDFARKQDRRIKDFLFFSQEKQRTYPWRKHQRIGILKFTLATVLVVPLLVQIAKGMRRCKDPAWWYHIPVCWITLWIYGTAALKKAIGMKPAARSRERWQAV